MVEETSGQPQGIAPTNLRDSQEKSKLTKY